MTTLEYLDDWKRKQILTEEQHYTLSGLARKDRFSVFFELNALLYIGVLSLAAGIAWTVTEHFTQLNDAVIVGSLTLLFLACLYYCFSRGLPYTHQAVESPTLVFDYVLYFGCLVLATELGYVENRFQVLKSDWDYYVLITSAVFFVFAYRFDNRFVLSLALSTLAGWFGLKVSRVSLSYSDSLRFWSHVYAGLTVVMGSMLYRNGIKRHFLETYLHIAANAVFIAEVSALLGRSRELVYVPMLLAFSIAAVFFGIRYKRFAFVVYGTVYGYIGLSIELLRDVSDTTTVLVYIVVTGTAVVLLIATLARRIGREE
jgi:predicted membrane protein DUF2157